MLLTWGLLVVATGVMGLLHLFQSEINPVQQPLSFYVHGRHGWLLPLALATFGSSAAALSLSLARTSLSHWAARWLISFGLGMLVAALVPADRWFPWEGPASISGWIHAAVAVLAPPLLLGAMGFLRRLAGVTLSSQLGLNVLALAYLVGLISSAVSLLVGFVGDRAPPLIGLTERVLALAAVGWLALATDTVRRRSTPRLKHSALPQRFS